MNAANMFSGASVLVSMFCFHLGYWRRCRKTWESRNFILPKNVKGIVGDFSFEFKVGEKLEFSNFSVNDCKRLFFFGSHWPHESEK